MFLALSFSRRETQVNTYRKLANIVFWFHWIWVAIILGSWITAAIFPWCRPIYLAVVTTTVISQVLWLGCPLVALENALRAKYDPSKVYSGSFICHYIKKQFGVRMSPLVITAQLAITMVASVIFWVR